MKYCNKISITTLLLTLSIIINAQIKNAKTETVKISGSCEMCKEKIENAGNKKNKSEVIWDLDSKTATITYNPEKTSIDNILKKIAQAGYDNEKFKAKKLDYNSLPTCCQYDKKE